MRSARSRSSLGQDHRGAFATTGRRLRASIDPAAGVRESRIDGATIRLGRPRGRLGLASAAVEVIDEDQGHSGKHVEDRVGFQRFVAEVGLNHVGLVLGIEVSR